MELALLGMGDHRHRHLFLEGTLELDCWLYRPRFFNNKDNSARWLLEQPGGTGKEEEGEREEAR